MGFGRDFLPPPDSFGVSVNKMFIFVEEKKFSFLYVLYHKSIIRGFVFIHREHNSFVFYALLVSHFSVTIFFTSLTNHARHE